MEARTDHEPDEDIASGAHSLKARRQPCELREREGQVRIGRRADAGMSRRSPLSPQQAGRRASQSRRSPSVR